MGFGQSLIAAIDREVRLSLREPWLIALFVVMPVFWCVVFTGLVNTGELRDLPVGVVNLDKTPASNEMLAKLDALPSVRLVSLASPLEAQSKIQTGEIYGLLTVPNGWTKYAGTPRALAVEGYFPKTLYAATVSLEIDIKTAMAAFSLESLAHVATRASVTPEQAARYLNVVNVQAVTLGNLHFNFVPYLLPVIIPGLLHLGLVLALITRFATEWQKKSVREWLQTSSNRLSCALLGKILPWLTYYSLLGAGFIAYLTGYCQWFATGNTFLWLLGMIVFFAVMATLPVFMMGLTVGFGWVIATSFCIGYIAPIFPFTGFSYPLDAMQDWVQWLAQCFPLTHYVQWQSQQWILDAPMASSLYTLAKMIFFALIWLGVGIPTLKKQIARAANEEQ